MIHGFPPGWWKVEELFAVQIDKATELSSVFWLVSVTIDGAL
jgi:hypothetical protein